MADEVNKLGRFDAEIHMRTSVSALAELVVRIHSPPAESPLRTQFGQRRLADEMAAGPPGSSGALGHRHDDPLLVNIKTDIRDTILHDPSPMHEARHRPIRRNPRYLHTVRRVAPYSGGHVV